MKNPCKNPQSHEAGTLPCCEGIVFRPIKKKELEDNMVYIVDSKNFYIKYPKTKRGKLDMRYSINQRKVLLGF